MSKELYSSSHDAIGNALVLPLLRQKIHVEDLLGGDRLEECTFKNKGAMVLFAEQSQNSHDLFHADFHIAQKVQSNEFFFPLKVAFAFHVPL